MDFVGPVQALARRLVEEPHAWPEVRRGVREMFDRLSGDWDEIATRPGHLDALAAALETVPPPRRALDLGTGTGRGAELVARRFSAARVAGLDLSEEMLRAATSGRVHYVLGDGAELPFRDGSFDLVVALNMFLFFGEIVRVLSPSGRVVIVYSGAERTPVWVPTELIGAGLRGFELHEARAGDGTSIVASRS